jgi:hypothetical protein
MADEAEICPFRVEMPIKATHPARHCPGGTHQDHLCDRAPTGLLHPGHPRSPGTSALVLLPVEQMSSASPASGGAALRTQGSPWAVAAPIFA